MLKPLTESQPGDVAVAELIDPAWDWICYATETMTISHVVGREFSWAIDIFESDGPDFVLDGNSFIILLNTREKKVERHQVNDEKLYFHFNSERLENCFESAESKFRFLEGTSGRFVFVLASKSEGE